MGVKILILTFVILFTASVFAQQAEPLVVGRITVASEAETLKIVRLGLDLMEYRDGDDLIFWTTPKQIDELRNSGWKVRMDTQLTAELPHLNTHETFLGGYRTVEETFTFLNQKATQYPNLAQVFTYGQSWAKVQNPANGYNLTAIRLTSDKIRTPKPIFFLQAGIHARELVPPEIATRFIDYLLANYGTDADATWLLDENQIIVIPIVNPDGRKIAEGSVSKRKNVNNTSGNCSNISFGIDLNRNFSYLWGTVNLPTEPPCGETFPGLSAASEPEARAIETLLSSIYPDQRAPGQNSPAPHDATGIYLDMHSTGNLILYPWGQDTTPPPNIQLRTIAQKMAAYNGYDPIQSIELYPTSGTAREFAYGELGVAGLAMEIGLGSGTCGGFMPAYSCLDGGTNGGFWLRNRPVLIYLAKLARTPYLTSEGPAAETAAAIGGRLGRFAIIAQISDEFNGNQDITSAEAYIDTPPWRGGTPIPLAPLDGIFDSPVESVHGLIKIPSGRSIIFIRGRDAAGNWGSVKAVFVGQEIVIAKKLTPPNINVGRQ